MGCCGVLLATCACVVTGHTHPPPHPPKSCLPPMLVCCPIQRTRDTLHRQVGLVLGAGCLMGLCAATLYGCMHPMPLALSCPCVVGLGSRVTGYPSGPAPGYGAPAPAPGELGLHRHGVVALGGWRAGLRLHHDCCHRAGCPSGSWCVMWLVACLFTHVCLCWY